MSLLGYFMAGAITLFVGLFALGPEILDRWPHAVRLYRWAVLVLAATIVGFYLYGLATH